MLIKNCVLKYLQNDIWLHHTAGSYKVRMNAEAVAVLESMAARASAAEMTGDERLVYEKLEANGIAGKDTGRAGDRLIPVKKKSPLESVELEFSGRCNLTCAHCFSALSQKDMSADTLDRVFTGLDALEPVTLVVNGGEPLLNPLLPDALKRARARHMRVNVMTNATLADENTAALFAETGVAKAVVSLDFFNRMHDEIRGSGSFKRTVSGIKFLVAAKVPVFITAMVQDIVAGRLEEFRDFCVGGLGASGVRFSSVMPIGRGKDSAGRLGLAKASLKKLFSEGLLPPGDDSDDVFARLAGARNFYCNAGIGQCYISAGGKVYACHYFQNLGEEMGDLSAGPLEKIYRDYPASGAIAADFDWERLAKCKACAHFARCKGGCRARARLISGNWYDPDTFSCDMYGVQ